MTGPKPAINENVSRSGASYGVHESQKPGIPNEIMMQMMLGPERVHQAIMYRSKNPHVNKFNDFNYGRVDPANDNTPQKKPERDEGAYLPENLVAIMEQRDSNIAISKVVNDNRPQGRSNDYTNYKNPYQGPNYRGKPKLRVIEGGKGKSVYSNDPVDSVAARVEREAYSVKPVAVGGTDYLRLVHSRDEGKKQQTETLDDKLEKAA